MSSTAGSPPAGFAISSTDVKPPLISRPSLVMKPAQTPSAASPPPTLQTASLSLTSKEWVVPPRPKPGRKPATDTPPTKRKAQNRAAQRAFRERRAARVGELEETLKAIEDENDMQQDTLRADVARLEKEVEQYRSDLINWVDRCRRLENELAIIRAKSGHSQNVSTSTTSANRSESHEQDDTTVGCGNCTLDTRCQCIDDAFNAMSGDASTDVTHHEKRPRSPVHIHSEKRVKLEPKDSLEIDFTSIYASKPQPQSHHASRSDHVSPSSVIADPCGFCSDGTPCICAEMAAEQEQGQAAASQLIRAAGISPLPGHPEIHGLSQFTPPPSEGDVSISVLATASTPSGCGAMGPGTCTQCRADPNSTLFCKSLAASRAQSTNTSTPAAGGCCGGKAAGGGCCQSQSTQSVPLPPRTTRSRKSVAKPSSNISQSSSSAAGASSTEPKPAVTLTCADAYTTLSRHPNYERASTEIASWMPKLYASDVAKAIEGRPALEIDAANVMTVLKDFDRRFGQSR